MYSEDRAKGYLPKVEFDKVCVEHDLPNWFIDAVENQKKRYYVVLDKLEAIPLEKRFNKKGEMNKNYLATIKKLCEENELKFFENKLTEIDNYLKERQEEGWPSIKTGDDLILECQIVPLVRHCIQYLNGDLGVE